MRWFALIAAFALIACDSPKSDTGVSSTGSSKTTSHDGENAAPRGVPKPPPESFGALLTDVDRIVLTQRTVLVLDDAGMPTGDDAHPAVYEKTDPRWIKRFATAVGRTTTRSDVPADCAPWADLTLYAGDEVMASLAVDCSPRHSFETFKIRGDDSAYVGEDPEQLEELLAELQED